MQNVSHPLQTPSENRDEPIPEQSSEYQGELGPQGAYQQQPYLPNQPYSPYRQEQQQYWKPVDGKWSSGDVNPRERTEMGLKLGTAGLFCYLFGWVGGLVFFLLERNSRFVRFHAVQSLLFFGSMSILEWVCSFFPYSLFGFGGVIGLVSFIGWIVLMVAAYRGRYYKLPLLGDYAEQLVNRVIV